MQSRLISDSKKFNLTLDRLCHQLIENHSDFSHSVIIGIQPRGVFVADRIYNKLNEILKVGTWHAVSLQYGKLDPTFYRDDFRRSEEQLTPKHTSIDFLVENKKVILIDDVLYTGRTVRAAMDALLDFGRAEKVELLVLVDRRFTRHLPIQPDYVGITVDSIVSDKVKVEWKETDGEDKIWILSEKRK